MPDLHPFRAFRYSPAKVSIPQVVTQPYDKISPAMQDKYYQSSPYNLVRIILGKPQPSDHPGDNVYTRSAAHFRDWRAQGVLLQDQEQSVYQYVQRFVPPGGKHEIERHGFIALGKLEDYSSAVVHRHEQTLAKPKADRLDLLRATRAHFGQIFMLYSDPVGEIDRAIQDSADENSPSTPDAEVRDEYGVLHQLWAKRDSALIGLIRTKMRDKKLIIADGHHRYETALNYRNERRAAATSSPAGRGDSPPAPYDLAMMTFVNMDSPGLVILPTHRLVYGLSSFSSQDFLESARAFYHVEPLDSTLDTASSQAILLRAGQSGTALLAVIGDHTFLLKSSSVPGCSLLNRLSGRQSALDVVQLHKCLLEGVLGLSEESIHNQENIRYLRDWDEALAQVRSGAANIAFLMNPASMEQVRDIAFAGEVLPQKSTDFYPKLLSGLTIYALE